MAKVKKKGKGYIRGVLLRTSPPTSKAKKTLLYS